MEKSITSQQLIDKGCAQPEAEILAQKINSCLTNTSAEQTWNKISKEILTPQHPFSLHVFLFSLVYPDWQNHPETAAAWFPEPHAISQTHLAQFMSEQRMTTLQHFHAWTAEQPEAFWHAIIQKLGILFRQPPTQICDLEDGIESPNWLVGATFNITDSCFTALPSATAVIYQDKNHVLQKMTYGELNFLSNRIANSLLGRGFTAGDAIAIDMPMTVFAVAIYLGIIKMGGVVVSIADSFSSEEISTRLRITHTKAIFTQDFIVRGAKKIPLYEKVIAAEAPLSILLSCEDDVSTPSREQDITWQDFLVINDSFTSQVCTAMTHCNILFSSGTTADPKAIPWTHSTAIKAASDAFLHHNIQVDDVLAWPTNLGWMMGPWLIFAALINQASLALYTDNPKERAFGEFVQNAKVTCLGVVPTLVASWRETQCMQGLDWHAIKVFSSTGECSNAEDMLYLMSLAGYKPIIEYCGGTEIGGSYLTSTVIEKNCPSIFTTPAMGLDFVLIDEAGNLTDNGEVAIIPPSIGLSTELLNADHHKVYFANMPTPGGKILRRHGDQVLRFQNGNYVVLGRVDDTMNLGGIKISSSEIERLFVGIDGIAETAAIATPPAHGGPSQLIIYAVTHQTLEKEKILKEMQKRINEHLNPLFRIHDVVFIQELPRTASNKIMRRMLRKSVTG